METYTEPKRPANSPIPLRLVVYRGNFRKFMFQVREAIAEIEKNSPDRKVAGCPMESIAKS